MDSMTTTQDDWECVPEYCPEITPIEVKMSSVNDDKGGEGCIDGVVRERWSTCETHWNPDGYPWITLIIPNSTVHSVKVTNVWHQRRLVRRMKNMKIWIGDHLPTTSSEEYS